MEYDTYRVNIQKHNVLRAVLSRLTKKLGLTSGRRIVLTRDHSYSAVVISDNPIKNDYHRGMIASESFHIIHRGWLPGQYPVTVEERK